MKCNKTKSGALIFLLTFSGLFSAVIGLIDFNSINDPFEEKLEENPIDLRISDHNWTKLFLISENSTRDGQYPNIAMDGAGNIHIVWQDDSLEYDGTTYEDIIYRMWNATSGIWSASTLISTISTSYCYSPAIAVDNDNNIHVVWEDVTNILGAGTYYDIFYKYWNATTKVWSGHTGVYDLVTSNSSHVYDCENPDIAVDNDGNVHVVWWDENEGFGDGPGYDIFYKCWNRTTGVWGSVEVVSLEATGNGYGPSMAVDPSGNVHVVWYDYTDLHGAGTDGDIFYRFKNSTTGIWYGQINNTDVLKTSGNSYYPAIVADDQGNIHIVWYDSDSTFGAGTDYDIFYRYWNVTTQAWSGPNPFVISDYAASQSSYYPEIATDNASNIYVVWQQYGNQHGTDFNDDIVLRVWNASSGTWSVKELVSAILSFDSYWPEVAVDPTGAICVAWWEYIVAGDDDIFFKKTITTPPPPTTLDPILPNPTANLEIDLNWHETLSTHQYYLYRDTSFISSVAGLTPIAVLADPVTSYMDTVTQNGTYYYAVVAGNHIGNSSVSNCENVTVFSLKQNRRMRIANNADFPTYATSGNGSAANPWVIENYYIDGVRRTCINITDTTDYFILRNNTVYGGDNGILLNNVINGEIRNNTARFCSIGFHLLNSQDNRVINNTAYNNTGTETYSGIGFFLDNSDSNWLDGNWAFDNWGIAGLSYSGLGILLWSADSNNLTNNHVFHNYHYNTTYQYPQYGGIGILGMSSPAYNRFIKNVIFENRGYNNYHSMGVFFQGGGQGNVLEENTIYNQLLEGVYFRSSGTNNEFINNTIFDCQVGVRTIGTSSPIIMYNKLFNLADGLYLWGGSATVHKNEIWNNTGRGIYFVAAGNDIATNNTIYNNSVGIQTGNSNNIRLYNNTIFDNNNGISLGNMPNGVLIDNFVYNNTNYGITLYDNFTQITRNTISGHDVGIYVGSAGSFSVYSDITLNTITDNRVGIHLLRNKYTSLDNNEIYNNSEDGIFLESTNHSTVTSNIIMHSSDGIHLLYNVNTTVQFNEIYNCSLGIRIENTSLSNISWNLLFNNTQTLLELFGINNTIGINPSMYGPVLNPIVPNIVDDGWVHLQWQSLPWATYYQVFRDIVTIDEFWDIVGKTPVVNVTSNDGWDTQFASPGLYCYVVVAANTTEWSTISNYEWVNVTGIYGVPGTPILNPISPNPDYNGIIELDWNDVQNATKYYVYRDVSTIANISGLSPIAVVTDSNFTDTLILDGTFYYVILGGNPEHNGTISNCENVTVMISPIPETPNLDPITPSLDFDGIIQLDWTDAGNATVYFIYRDVVPILTLTGLTPIASTIQSNFTDTNFVDGVYYYAIVSGNLGWNSSPSNSENVTIWKQYPVGITLLNPISPSPDIDGIIQLDWDPAENATRYYVYKDTALILSVASLNPIATVTATNFTDYAPINGTFFYAIVGGNPLFNGTLSNSEWVTVAIPARTTTGWTIPIILSPDSKNSSTSPTMAMDAAGNLFVVWSDNSTLYGSGGDADIFCRIWNASSQTWGSINVVSNESDSDSTAPAIAIDALGNLHVAWVDLSDWNGAGTDGDIFYKIYNTSTEAWSQTVVVTTESATASNGPAIGVNNLGNIYIVWCESNASETNIYEMFWNATSSSWSGNTTVSSEIVGDSRNPQIGVDENYNVHIVWEASSSSLSSGADDDIFYRMWNETGQSWSGTELVSLQSLLDSNSPSTVVEADGTVHLAWHDLTPYAGSGGDYDIFYKYRNVGTGLWSGNVNSTDVVSYGSDGPSIYPFITLDTDSELHIVWSDYSDVFGAGTDADIFYKFWNSSSLTWQGYINYSDVVTVESSEDAFSASVAVTKNQQGTIAIQVHVVWQDATDFGFGADWDVYYKSFLDIYPIPTTPYLYPITPAIDYDGEIFLDWTASNNATKYFVYRDVSNITDVSFLVPIAILATKINYTDTVSVDGTYYYVVVAGNQRFNSSLSNCENVTFVRYYPVTTPTLDPIVPNPDYDGLIALNWSSAENATIYYVYVDVSVITNVSALTPIKTTIDTNEEVQLTDGTYYFVVVAGNLGFNGSLSNCVNVTVNIQYPVTTPILLPITPNPSYDGLINLDWSDATNATVYYIYRHFTNITNITGLVPIANANQSNYLDITNDNTTWYYVIVAGNLAYNSSISNCENVTVTIVPIPETPILNFIFPSTNYYGNVSLDWTDTANTTHYYVYRDLYPLSNITGLTPIATVWDSNYTDYNFIDGTYSYFIVSANLGRNGSTSNIQNVTIEMYYPISTPNLSPIVPSVDYDGIIDLDWDDAPNATQYNVYRDSLPLDVVTQSNYTDMIFTNGTYTYTIMAGNPGYNSSLSNAENVTVNKYWPVGTPILEAIAPQLDYDGIIYLNWSTAENASQYYLYRDTVPINTVTGLTPHAVVVAQTNYTDVEFTDGTYYYVVIAGNLGYNSTISNSRNVTVLKQYPVGFSLIDPISPRTDTDGVVHLTWLPAENASFYRLYKDTAEIFSANGLQPIATVSSLNYTDYSPINGTFWYSVVPGNPLYIGVVDNSQWVTVAIPARTTTGWTPPEVLSDSSANDSSAPTMAMDASGNKFVAWADATDILGAGSDVDIFCRIWNATTGSWESIVVVSTESDSNSTAPALAMDRNDNLHVTWVDLSDWNGAGTDADVFYKLYNASIGAWTTTEVITSESSNASNDPSIVVNSQGNVFITWWETNVTQTNIYNVFWNVTASSWSGNSTVSTEIVGDSRYPQINVDNANNIHFLWEASSSSFDLIPDIDIFYRMYNWTSQSLHSTEIVSTLNLTFDSNCPTMTVDTDGNVYAAWHDLAPYASSGSDEDIFFRYRNVTTGTWQGFGDARDVISTESDAPSLYPSISVDNELNIHICWIDSSDINGTGPDADVFYKFYNRTAGIWKGIVNTTDVISGESSGDSIAPSIITGSIYLVWQDKTHFGFGTDWDIFFKSLIIIEAEGPGPEIDDDGGSKIWIIIIIIIGVVAGVAALFVFRTRSKPSVVGIKPSKMQLGDARSQLNQSESIPEKIHVLQKNNIPVELVVELYDPQLTDFFGQAFTSVPMELVEFLQKLDAPLEEKLEILEEFNNLTDELKQEFLEELTKI